MRMHFTMAYHIGPSMPKYLEGFLVPPSQSTLLTPEKIAALGKVTKEAKLDWNLTGGRKTSMKWQWHFTWLQDMGYLPSFTCVSNRSPPTYMFHVLHKKKPAARIKYLTAIPLSKYSSVSCCNLVVGRHRVLAGCGCPAREGQAGLCSWLPDVIHPTHCTCVTLGSCHIQLWSPVVRAVPMECWAEWHCFKYGSYQRKNS